MTAPAIPCDCGHDRLDHDWWGSGPCLACKCERFVLTGAVERAIANIEAGDQWRAAGCPPGEIRPAPHDIPTLLAEFKAKNEQLHREWTDAVGTPGYVKSPWRDRDNELVREYRDKLTALGYPRDAPLLPNGGAR